MQSQVTRCAVVQLCSTQDVEQNLERAEHWIRQAAADGADVVSLPENFSWLRIDANRPAPAQPVTGSVVARMRTLARELSVHLLLGSFPESADSPDAGAKNFNSSIWIDRAGEIEAVYRKQHLFDIELVGQESHRESDMVLAGDTDVIAHADGVPYGLSICYDLRFPELYRRLVAQGALALTVPAAFTLNTGKDHWHALLRARAIENQCYVIAPGQSGFHGGKRRSYGHSVIIDPWGTILADVPDGEGFAVARLDWQRLADIREQLPALQHRRDIGPALAR